MSRIIHIWCAVALFAAPAAASPITPTAKEEAARQTLGSRLPNARLLWVSGGKIYFSTIKDFSPRLVTAGSIPETYPRWSPDGTKILYVKEPKGVWIMNADFGGRVEVIPDGHTASWTRDGKSITAIKTSNARQALRYDLADGKLTVIYDSQDSAYSGGQDGGDYAEPDGDGPDDSVIVEDGSPAGDGDCSAADDGGREETADNPAVRGTCGCGGRHPTDLGPLLCAFYLLRRRLKARNSPPIPGAANCAATSFL